jgi:hypothetical protein
VAGQARLETLYRGGWIVAVASEPARVGERSRAARVLSEGVDGDGTYRVAIQALAGSAVHLATAGPRRHTLTGNVTSVTPLDDAAFEDPGAGRQTWVLRAPQTGADADNFVTFAVRLRVASP